MPMNHAARRFNRWFLAVVGIPVAGLTVIGLQLNLEPLDGDMTRLGGYSENDFGWHGRIETFERKHSAFGFRYDRYYDVLVLGDSFSHGSAHAYWQNYFHQATGLTMLTIPLKNADTLEGILTTPEFRAHPPRLFVYESAEHMMPQRIREPLSVTASRRRSPTPGLRRAPQALATVQHGRLDGVPSIRLDFSLTQNYLYKTIRRDGLHLDGTQVKRYRLNRSDLFSNRRSGEVLINKTDMIQPSWTKAHVDVAKRYIHDVQARVEANGRTRFVLMPAADKLTAYADYIADSAARTFSPLEGFERDRSLAVLPLTTSLKQAIASGRPDVYMPNDMHWGPEGHRIAAQSLVTHLERTAFFAPTD
jgi:hypothetical protein